MKLPEIIGISGTNGSGKDTLAALRHKKVGAEHVSLSDILRVELNAHEIPLERENLMALSKRWREETGDFGILATRTIQHYLGQQALTAERRAGLSIVSVRHPDEARRIHEIGGKVFWIDADVEVRYERIQQAGRKRIDDEKSLDEFIQEDLRELSPSDNNPASVNLQAVADIADERVVNNFSTQEEYEHYLIGQYLK
jgi:cytidylate kinase